MFITIRSYSSLKKADYIKFRLERLGIESKIIDRSKDDYQYKIQVRENQVERTVAELLQVKTEYPEENFELNTDPCDLMYILIPIDFSEKSIEAAKYALDIAANRPVEVKFIHVWNDEMNDFLAVRDSHSMEDFKRMQRRELETEIQKSLETFMQQWLQLVQETNTKRNLLYHFTIEEGIVKNQLEQAVYGYKPNLVICAHNDHKSHKFRISRDIAAALLGTGVCPVYYIPQKVKYETIGDIHLMYATNFDEQDLLSFQHLQLLTTGYKTKFFFLHVSSEESRKDALNKMEKLLHRLHEVNTSGAEIRGDVITNAVLLNGFIEYIEENEIDMVSFSSPEYGLWHKLFNPDELKNIMNGASLPLLLFRHKK